MYSNLAGNEIGKVSNRSLEKRGEGGEGEQRLRRSPPAMDTGMNWPRTRWVLISIILSLAAVFGLYEMTKALNNSG